MTKLKLITIIVALIVIVCAGYLVAGLPAARVGDYHTCPASDYVWPNTYLHVGGPILTGSQNVNICGMPAAFATCTAQCQSPIRPIDEIAVGSATVLINGKPAARVGDLTIHGGYPQVGCSTVLIGD